jgi:hypothetical protein
MFLDEALVAGGTVPAHSDDGIARLLQLLVVVADGACLGRAAGGVVLRIGIEDEFLSGKLGEAYLLSVLVVPEHFGQFVSYFQHIVFD